MKRTFSIFLIIVMLLCMTSCDNKKNTDLKVEDLHAICELATVKCYYNNVAHIEKDKDNVFQRERKMWMEYEGEAIIGINMSKLKIKINNNTVTITMPKAEVLSISPNRDTLNDNTYVSSKDGFIFKNKITTEDQEMAISKGQEEMKMAIENNGAIFVKAEDKARELIGSYIETLSKIVGKEYVIKWK